MEVARIGEIANTQTDPEDTDEPENSLDISLHAQTTAGRTERLPGLFILIPSLFFKMV